MSIVYVEKQIGEVVIDPKISLRGIDDDHVQDLMHAQLEYGESEWQERWQGTLIITEDFHVVDGHHTLEAARVNFGDDHLVKFEVRGKTFRDAYFLATGTNASHGKRRSNEEKRLAVMRWLEDDDMKEWTDGCIAKHCYVAGSTVTRISDELVQNMSYTRPTKRKYLDRFGKIIWIETAEIGNGSEPSPQPELPGVPSTDAAKSEALHAEWVSISLKVGKCLQDLDFKHFPSTTLIRRLKAPRETVAWTEDAHYEKGIQDAQAWLTEFSDWRASAEANGSTDGNGSATMLQNPRQSAESPAAGGEMALMLEELSLINEVLEIYKPLLGSYFHEEMLSTDGIDAKTAVMRLGSADYELQDRNVRMECLRDLKKVFAHVCRFEEEARAAKAEVDRQAQEEELIGKARETFKASKASVSKAWKDSGIQCHLLGDVDEEAVVPIAAKAFDCDFGMLFEMFSVTGSNRLSNLSLKELNQWRLKLDEIRVALEQKGECFSNLFSQPEACLKEIKTELHKQNTLDYLDDAALKDSYKVDGETLAVLKDQANADGCQWIEAQHARYLQEAFDIYLNTPEYTEHDWAEFWKAAAEDDSRLSLETFDKACEKESDILDYRFLYNELNGIKRFKQHLKEKRGIVERFLTKPELDALKADLKKNHWDHAHNWDEILPPVMDSLAEKYHCTAENVRVEMDNIESEAKQKIKIDHSNACLRVQSAFFDNDLDDLMKAPGVDEMDGRLKDFFAWVVDAKDLRMNIFSDDTFYLNETGYLDRSMTYSEIQNEIVVLDAVATDVREKADWVMALFAKTSAADASKADTNHYSLESVTITFKDADYNIQSPLYFRAIASRQLDERSMVELPDALTAELLKLVNGENV